MLRTKIIATLGPASSSPEAIGRLVEAGADVFRLNFSHGTLEEHGKTLDHIRNVCRDRGASVAVMADLCGPKIRVGEIEGDAFEITVGQTLDIVADDLLGSAERISTNRRELVHEVAVGHRFLIDDGNVHLRVTESRDNRLTCICEIGGRISNRKGINLPDSDLDVPSLTDKDRIDLAWAVEHGVDYIAVSFVRTADDLVAVRDLLPLSGPDFRIVAKIETPQATAHLDEIIEAADVVLVARGDLGVEMDLARVPIIQKRITRLCQLAGRPVIIATQMLQSMVDSPTPTRAEVSDVANAILDSADCVMLSAETAISPHHVAAVQMIVRIGLETEAYLATTDERPTVLPPAMRRVTTAVAHGASVVARELSAKLVAVWTEHGDTARLLSKHRLPQRVVGLSPDDHVCRRMAMYFGVEPVRMKRNPSTPQMLCDVDAALLERGLAEVGDLIVVIAGTHLDEPGATNALEIHLVAGPDSGSMAG